MKPYRDLDIDSRIELKATLYWLKGFSKAYPNLKWGKSIMAYVTKNPLKTT